MSWVLNAYAISTQHCWYPWAAWRTRSAASRCSCSASGCSPRRAWRARQLRPVVAGGLPDPAGRGRSCTDPDVVGPVVGDGAGQAHALCPALVAVAGIAAAAGPVWGGILVTASWRWVFLVNLPVGLIALVAATRAVPDSRDSRVSRLPDLAGAGLLTTGIGTLALALVKGGDWGWGDGRTIASFVVAALLLAGFVRRAERHPVPVVEPDLYRVRSFAAANVAMITFSIGFAGYLLTVVLWMQNVWHWSTITTGLAVAPGPAIVPVVTVLVQRYCRRVHPGVLTALGCLAFAAGIIMTLALAGPNGSSYASELLPGQLVSGVGIGLALPTLLSSATARTAGTPDFDRQWCHQHDPPDRLCARRQHRRRDPRRNQHLRDHSRCVRPRLVDPGGHRTGRRGRLPRAARPTNATDRHVKGTTTDRFALSRTTADGTENQGRRAHGRHEDALPAAVPRRPSLVSLIGRTPRRPPCGTPRAPQGRPRFSRSRHSSGTGAPR